MGDWQLPDPMADAAYEVERRRARWKWLFAIIGALLSVGAGIAAAAIIGLASGVAHGWSVGSGVAVYVALVFWLPDALARAHARSRMAKWITEAATRHQVSLESLRSRFGL